MTSGNKTFAQVSSILYDFNGSLRKVSTTWHRSHWKYKQSCCKDIIVQEKTLLPLLGFQNDKFGILFFFPVYESEILTDLANCREMPDDLWNGEES